MEWPGEALSAPPAPDACGVAELSDESWPYPHGTARTAFSRDSRLVKSTTAQPCCAQALLPQPEGTIVLRRRQQKEARNRIFLGVAHVWRLRLAPVPMLPRTIKPGVAQTPGLATSEEPTVRVTPTLRSRSVDP